MAQADRARTQRIEELVLRLEAIPDRESRETAQALMEAVLELHGSGLERMMDLVFEAGEPGKAAIRRFAGDPLIASLLVLHGLHPDDIETRAQHALTKTHAKAELLGVFEGVVRVRVTASGMKEAVEAALREAVPDAADILIEESFPSNDFVPLAALGMSVPGSV